MAGKFLVGDNNKFIRFKRSNLYTQGSLLTTSDSGRRVWDGEPLEAKTPPLKYTNARGTAAHQLGSQSFLDVRDHAQSSTSMRVVQGLQSGFSEAVSKQARENCAKKRVFDEKRRAARSSTSLDASSLSPSLLSCSKTLREMRGCQWLGMRHVCPTLVAGTSASDAKPEVPLLQLANSWQKRHTGIPEAPATRTRTQPQQACFREGSCMCKAAQRLHRELMKRCNKNIQGYLQGKGLSERLQDGQIILGWIRTGLDDDEESAEEPEVIWSYVALHYKKPWRPTLLMLRLLHLPSETPASLRRLLGNSCANESFNFEIITEDKGGFSGLPAFRTWREFILGMSLECRWSLRFFSLSDRNRVSLLPVGRVTAIPLDSEATSVWRGPDPVGAPAQELLDVLLPPGEQGDDDNGDEADVQSNGSGNVPNDEDLLNTEQLTRGSPKHQPKAEGTTTKHTCSKWYCLSHVHFKTFTTKHKKLRTWARSSSFCPVPSFTMTCVYQFRLATIQLKAK